MADVASADRPAEFGIRMKRLRVERGIDLRTVANSTNISIRTLESLERDDFARLPGGIFLRGMVRAYAAEIGEDPEAAIAELVERFPHESVTLGRAHAERAHLTPDQRGRLTPTVVAILALVAIVLFAWWIVRW